MSVTCYVCNGKLQSTIVLVMPEVVDAVQKKDKRILLRYAVKVTCVTINVVICYLQGRFQYMHYSLSMGSETVTGVIV